MPIDETADEVLARYTLAMGPDLGAVFHRLWNECVWLHMKWSDFEELFGTRAERIDLLNAAAPRFFWQLQSTYWEDILLHLARLTDPPSSAGQGNLSLRRLVSMVDPQIRPRTEQLLDQALRETNFARDWRDRRIAHRNLALATQAQTATPLETANRKKVADSLRAIVALMQCIEGHYCNSETVYAVPQFGSAVQLLHVLRDGLDAESDRQARVREGKYVPGDFDRRALGN